ncbi:hypothetical protein Scep_000175 [Stephania cephalantha]|uniref:Uncharacterized protein n=1 Tax=Stephania cephalantha TaxID=152367 RepID=A0AAP0L9S2_9MAGN
MKMLRPDFCTLKNLHDCANDLLSPVTQQALAHHRHERWVDEVSEGFLRVLDACGITRDVLFLVKEHLQHLQSALRRSRVAEQGLQKRIGAYHYSRNKMKKEMHKCLETLKGMTDSFTPSALSDSDHNVVSVVVVLREVRMITISIVESILSLMSVSKPKRKSKRQSILKFLLANRAANASDGHFMLEVDTALSSLATIVCVQNRR